MAKIKFREIKMGKANLLKLETINKIIEEYQMDGYVLTLRQLYYQLVSRDIVPNKQAEYSKLSGILKEGRMSGHVDWNAIEDRLRQPSSPPSWENPAEIIDSCIDQYALPRSKGQETYIEVWVEKDALSGVLKRVTEKYHIPIMVNRGYSSVSAMYDAFNRFKRHTLFENQKCKILYLGDFDPSGLDMIRDVEERMREFIVGSSVAEMDFEIIPIALTMGQIKKYNPPPNPAKITDPRAKDFIKKHGNTSWEVDALPPQVLNSILDRAILKLIDLSKFNEMVLKEKNDIDQLTFLKSYL